VRRIPLSKTGTVAIAVVATAATIAPTLTATAATSPPRTTNHAAAAAGWLARQLVGTHHNHYTVSFGSQTFVDYGETADGVLSMDAAGVSHDAADRAVAFLANHVDDYAKGSPTYYPGSVAKLILVATAHHKSVHDFGGVDLVTVLRAAEGSGDAAPGEFQQNPGFPGSTSYIVSQALAVLALAVAPRSNGPDSAAVSFLVGQQCDNGGFMSTIRDTSATPTCGTEEVDSTGYAVQALLAAGAKTAALAAVHWLQGVQHTNGSFGSPANANSTALGAQALLAAHYGLHGALTWLVRHQLGCSAPAAQRGGIAFTKVSGGPDLRATAQATAALAHKPLAWIDDTGAKAASPVLAC
jgi:hypothetical protein